jgi:hypothetical protein
MEHHPQPTDSARIIAGNAEDPSRYTKALGFGGCRESQGQDRHGDAATE